MPSQIFISHSSLDRTWVELLAVQARALGIVPYLAEHDPRPGTLLSEKVRGAIRASEAVVVLLTTSSIESPYVHQEIGVALEQGKLVVPLVHPAVVGRSLAMLDGVEYILFDFDAPAVGASALIERLREISAAAEQRLVADRREELIQSAVLVAAVLVLVAFAARPSA